jgi:hypothetical protein
MLIFIACGRYTYLIPAPSTPTARASPAASIPTLLVLPCRLPPSSVTPTPLPAPQLLSAYILHTLASLRHTSSTPLLHSFFLPRPLQRHHHRSWQRLRHSPAHPHHRLLPHRRRQALHLRRQQVQALRAMNCSRISVNWHVT